MRAHYQPKPVSLAEVRREYRPWLSDGRWVYCQVAVLDGKPMGSLQCCRVWDNAEIAGEIGEAVDAAVDDYVAEVDADAKTHAQVFRRLLISSFKVALNIHRTAHRLDRLANLATTLSPALPNTRSRWSATIRSMIARQARSDWTVDSSSASMSRL